MYICLDAYLSFGQNWKKRNIRFFRQKKHSVGEKSQSDASLSMLIAELLESVT